MDSIARKEAEAPGSRIVGPEPHSCLSTVGHLLFVPLASTLLFMETCGVGW